MNPVIAQIAQDAKPRRVSMVISLCVQIADVWTGLILSEIFSADTGIMKPAYMLDIWALSSFPEESLDFATPPKARGQLPSTQGGRRI
jgi:hypothetical protein